MKARRSVSPITYNQTGVFAVVTDETRKDLREKQLYLLKTFIAICEQHGLRYFLVGGSALGAIRHQGYIPWDDDIDVALPRAAYNEFLQVALSALPQDVFLQTSESDSDYRNDYAKLRLNGTTFLEVSAQKLNIHHGVYMDIFPIDGYPASEAERKRLKIKKHIMKAYVGKDYVNPLPQSSGSVKILLHRCKKVFVAFLCGFQSTAQVLRRLNACYEQYDYNACDEVVCHGGAWGEREHCPKVQYGNGCHAVFEGIDVVIPEQYDAYLSHKYGNYMALPPVEKRVAHHYCSVVDLTKSYTEYWRGAGK